MRISQVAQPVQYAPAYQPPQPAGTLHAELTADGTRIALMAAGSDWDRDRICVLLEKLTCELSETGTGAMTVPATWAVAVQLGWTFRDTGLVWAPRPRLRDWMAAEAARRYARPPPLEKSWPDGLEPRDYQVEDARQLAVAGKALLLHEMGVGKSLIAILGLEQRRRLGTEIFPLCIVAPSRDVADHWQREISTWMPSWPAPQMYLDPGRERLLDSRDRVLVTTYATATLDAPAGGKGPLHRYRPAAVVLDEAQYVQSARAERTKACERIAKHAATVIELSGTLFTRDTGGSFAPLKILDPGTWGDKGRYKERFLLTRKTEYAETVTGLNPATRAEFDACLAGQLIRRTKRDVLPQLPPKVYSVLRPDIPPGWRQAYTELRDDMLANLPDGGELPVFDTLTQMTRLSQLASCAADVEWEEVLDERTGLMVPKAKVTLRAPSWKAETLMGIMAKATAPVAVYTASRQLAVITGRDYLEKAGYRTGYILGTGQGITQGTRKRDIAAFQRGELDAIVCTAKAGGVGITLTAADTVVFLQRDLEFDKAIQPEDRAHRLGQLADQVHIVDVVAKGTFDERARELIHEKGAKWAEFCKDPDLVRSLLGGKR